MRIGVVLPTYIYDAERVRLAAEGLQSLFRTQVKGLSEIPVLVLMVRKPEVPFPYPELLDGRAAHAAGWEVIRMDDPPGVQGVDQTLAYGTSYLVNVNLADWVVWMGDDSRFNSTWLLELQKLIRRHPQAAALSVYRSAYEYVHQVIKDDDKSGDLQVSSIGYGMTVSRQEWLDWGVDWKKGHWACPSGDTLDLCHIYDRPDGARWVTPRSYIDHTGRTGVHCRPEIPEYAVDFVQEPEEA